VQPFTYRGVGLLGAVIGIWLDPVRALGDALDGGRDIVAFRFGERRVYIVNGPELVKAVLRANNAFVKPGMGSRFTVWFGSGGLVDSRAFRSFALPAFERRRIEPLVSAIDRAVSTCFARFDYHALRQRPINVTAEALRLSLVVSGRVLFNVDMRRDAERIDAALDTLQTYYSAKPVRVALGLADRARAPDADAARAAAATLHRIIDQMIAGRRSVQERPDDLFSELLQAGGSDMPPAALRNVVMAALLSSYETTGCALAWSLICLARHGDHAERVAAEGAMLPPSGDISIRALDVLGHTRRVFREALRLYPPSWIIFRETKEAQILCGYEIAARSTVLLCPYWIHRHPRYWPQPERFDPDRFLHGGEARHPGAYIPFGAGPHGCFGERYAELVVQIALARLLGRYRMRLASPSPVVPRALISLKPADSATALMIPRDSRLETAHG
jgi:cytochrome P450